MEQEDWGRCHGNRVGSRPSHELSTECGLALSVHQKPSSRHTLRGESRGSTPPPSGMEQGDEPQVGQENTWDTTAHCCDVRGVGESDAFATASLKFPLISVMLI